MTPTVNLDEITLEAGGHQPDGKFCVMELAAYIAGETDWLVRVCAPAFLDLADLADEARSLRDLAPLDGSDAAKLAQPTIRSSREKADAAWDAAGDAAGAAARDAARDALAPTVADLQTSAFKLLDKMIGDKAAA